MPLKVVDNEVVLQKLYSITPINAIMYALSKIVAATGLSLINYTLFK